MVGLAGRVWNMWMPVRAKKSPGRQLALRAFLSDEQLLAAIC